MARSMPTWMRVVAVAALGARAAAQDATCYYPNGVEAAGSEQPCSSAEGSACCPLDWQCLDNGLCYYEPGKLYGAYSCTDQNWNSPGCPSNLCMYGPAKDQLRAGGESITQCPAHNNDFCCNADATHVNCCKESPSPRPFFQLQDGKAYATVGKNQASTVPTLSSITGLATGSGGGSQPSRTPSPSSSADASSGKADAVSSSTSGKPTPVPSVSISLSSGSAGVKSIPVTIYVTPTPGASNNGPSSSSGGGSSSNLGLIIGCAVGIPLALALLGILIWLLRKRRTQKKSSPYKETPEMEDSPALPGTPGFAGGASAKLGKDVYRHSRPGTAEIDGAPIGATRPVSNVPGHAELASGAGFQPGQGTAYAPDTVGLGGGNGDGRAVWGNAPPSYSPGMNQTSFAHPPHAMELADTSVTPVINEKEGAQQQQYQAYRPPQPAAELPSVKTPPEDLERQVQK